MLDALRRARLLHTAIVLLSLTTLAIFTQRSPVADLYAEARVELAVLGAFLGRSPVLAGSDAGADSTRMRNARELVDTRVDEHVHWVLSRSLAMALGGDLDPGISVRWEIPIVHQSKLPVDADLLEIRSHFAAIPVVALQPDLAELAWLLTSQLGAGELAQIRSLRIAIDGKLALEEQVRRAGFEAAEDGVGSQVTIRYQAIGGELKTIRSPLLGRIVRMPDLNQRGAFHNSFPHLERVFQLVEFQTPEQALLTLVQHEEAARPGLLQRLSASTLARMLALVGTPLLLLLLLGHVRHLLDTLPGTAPPTFREFGWFPLFFDPNSRRFELLTLMILPAAGPAAWMGSHLAWGPPIPIEDALLYSAASAVCMWIGGSLRSEFEELRACIQEPAESRSSRDDE